MARTSFAKMDSLDWNDLRYLIAVVRNGSASAAARALGVSHATVLRRLQTLEQGVGTPLFYRLPTGYEPTEAGQQLAEVGASIETTVTKTRRQIDVQTTDLAGTIRFTTTDSLASTVMPTILKHFHKCYPKIKIEMIATSIRLDLDRRDADVVLRPTREPPGSWVGMPLGALELGLYVSTKYLAERRREDWRNFEWIIPGGPLSQRPFSQWLIAQVPEEQRVMTADSFVTMRELALEGVGATVLPHPIGSDERLQLLEGLPPNMSAPLWLLTHANLRQAKRVNAFMQHVSESVRTVLQASSQRAITEYPHLNRREQSDIE
jgi:DNA-binding transcriptional LysR family regulator